MNLLTPWRWFRAAVVELAGVAACLLLIGFSHAERSQQPHRPSFSDQDTSVQRRHNHEYTEASDGELWQILGAVLEKTLK